MCAAGLSSVTGPWAACAEPRNLNFPLPYQWRPSREILHTRLNTLTCIQGTLRSNRNHYTRPSALGGKYQVISPVRPPVTEVNSFWGIQRSRCLPLPPGDGKTSSFRNFVLYFESRTMDKVQKASACLQILFNSPITNRPAKWQSAPVVYT
jgi:hypothetical protein